MPIDFYYLPGSPPCRSIQMAAAAVGIELNEIPTELAAGKHLTPEFIKMNPQHTIPTIRDGNFALWESRAILGYLINKYGKDDRYYPQNPVKRAVVDQRLYFDMGTLYQRFSDYVYPQVMANAPADPEKLKKLIQAVEFLNVFLEGSKYCAGEDVTIADFAILASISTFVEGCNLKLENYPNIQRWYKEARENVPGYEKTEAGLVDFKSWCGKVELQ